MADARRLLGEAQDRTDRNQKGVLEAMRPALTRCGFRGDPPWVSGQAYISPPATFPDYYEVWGRDNAGQGAKGQRKITSVPALVGYLERALALVDAGGASALPSRERPRTGVTESPWTADEDAALRRAVAAARVSGRVNWTSVLGQLLDSRRTEAALRARWDQLGDQPAPQPARSTSPRSRAVAWAAVHPLLGGDDGLPLPPPTRRPPPLSSALPTTALTDETGECTICYDDGVKIATLKCCGNKACASCLGRLKEHDWKCYWCRQHVPERSLRAALNGVEVWPPPRPKSAVRKTDEQRRVEPPRERDAPPRPRRAPPSIVGEGAPTRGPGDVDLSGAGPDYICRLGETPGHVGNLLHVAPGAILDLDQKTARPRPPGGLGPPVRRAARAAGAARAVARASVTTAEGRDADARRRAVPPRGRRRRPRRALLLQVPRQRHAPADLSPFRGGPPGLRHVAAGQLCRKQAAPQ